jgi:hypothetical protein
VAESDLGSSSAPAFSSGDTVHLTTSAAVYRGGDAITAPSELTGAVADGPVLYNGSRWYELETPSGTIWATAAVLDAGVGDSYKPGDAVATSGDTRAWVDGQFTTIGAGLGGEVARGPILYDGTRWYGVETQASTLWIPETGLEAGADGAVTANATVTLDRDATGYLGDQNVTVDADQTGTVVGGPVLYDDDLWYQVRTDQGDVWLPLAVLDESSARRTE